MLANSCLSSTNLKIVNSNKKYPQIFHTHKKIHSSNWSSQYTDSKHKTGISGIASKVNKPFVCSTLFLFGYVSLHIVAHLISDVHSLATVHSNSAAPGLDTRNLKKHCVLIHVVGRRMYANIFYSCTRINRLESPFALLPPSNVGADQVGAVGGGRCSGQPEDDNRRLVSRLFSLRQSAHVSGGLSISFQMDKQAYGRPSYEEL